MGWGRVIARLWVQSPASLKKKKRSKYREETNGR